MSVQKSLSGRILYFVSAIVVATQTLFAASFSDNFASGINTANWLVQTNDGLVSITDQSGTVVISKPAGTQLGFHYGVLACHVAAQGDFTAQIDFTNANVTLVSGTPGNQLQFNCRFGGQDFLVVRSDETAFGQNMHVWLNPPAQSVDVMATTAASGTLKITRSGAQVSGYMNSTLIYQGTFNTNDATFSFVLQNNGTDDAISAGFSNFQLTASNLVVTPPSLQIQPQGTNYVILWPDRSWPDFYLQSNILQSTGKLAATNSWGGIVVTPTNGMFSVTQPFSGTAEFFRLEMGP